MIITGNIGRDPETKTTKGGRAFLSFTVAESYGKEDNRTTNWFSISYFGSPEGLAGMTKGTRVEVEGDLKVNAKENKAYLDILTSRVKLAPLPPKKEQNAGAATGSDDAGNAPPSAGAPTGAPAGGLPDQFNDMDDDIPF
jgi:single-strand DNA-binding protein